MAKINPVRIAILLQEMPECLRQLRSQIRQQLIALRSPNREVAIRAAWRIGCLVLEAIGNERRYGECPIDDLAATTPGVTHKRLHTCRRIARSFTESNIAWLLGRKGITLRHVELLARARVRERRELFEQIRASGVPRLKDLREKLKPWSRW